jgi:predicted permease
VSDTLHSAPGYRRGPRRASRLAHALLRAASWIVPRHARRNWLDEWTAELWILDNRNDKEQRSPTPLALSLGAVPHSLWQRKEWALAFITQDIRAAVRTLTRNPGFTALALLTMALGIGANTTIFSMANATLLRAPGGIDEPGRIVQIGRDRPEQGFDNMAYPWFRHFRDNATGLEQLAAYTSRALVVGRGAEVAVLNGQLVTGDYFSLLGVEAHLGRLLGATDDHTPGAHAVAIISHGLWTSRYGADPAILGRDVRINGSQFEIIGVAERGFAGTDVVASTTDVWIPLLMVAEALGPRYRSFDEYGMSWLWMIGKLAEGTTPQSLRAELNGLYKPAYEETWEQPADHDIGVVDGVGLRPDERTAVARLMVALMLVVAVVLAVACANLANLLLARGIARSQEMGIRTALGASRGRLVRELLTESVVLALGGGLLALLMTYWTAGLIPVFLPIGLGVSFRPDLNVFAFAVGVSLVAGVVFGLAPAWRSSRANLVESIKEASPLTGRRAGWLRGGLVVGQLALSFALLAVTGLLVQSLLRANAAQPGYNTRDLITLTVDVDLAGYEQARGEQFFVELATAAQALPGAEAAALGANLPFAGWSRRGVYFPEERPDLERQFVEIDTTTVDRDYFRTLQIPLLRGEVFDAANSGAGMPRVVVISESMARLFWPQEEALGKLLPLTEARVPEESMRVIGVVADVQVRSLREPPRPAIYLPLSQDYESAMTLFVRTAGDPAALAGPLQGLVQDLDPDLGILQLGLLHERMGNSLRDTLTVARLGGVFGVLAAILAAVGLYGVVAYVASSRTHEVGVRMALGARGGDIVALFVRQALALTVVAIAVGTLLTVAAGGGLASFLYGVAVHDPLTLTLIAAGVLVLGLLAAAVPAMRASKVDPASALHHD